MNNYCLYRFFEVLVIITNGKFLFKNRFLNGSNRKSFFFFYGSNCYLYYFYLDNISYNVNVYFKLNDVSYIYRNTKIQIYFLTKGK